MLLNKQLCRFGFTAIFFVSSAYAQMPDPMDSVIIESKATGAIVGVCQSAGFRLRVWVTNKDTLTRINFPLEEKMVADPAYAILSRTASCARTLSSVFNFLYSFAGDGTPRLPNRTADFSGYHGNSPDTFLWSGNFDAMNDSSKFPPNPIRIPLLEIKFDTVIGGGTSTSLIEIDSISAFSVSFGFADALGSNVNVNFTKGVVLVCFCDSFPTSVTGESDPFPINYKLSQNFPNPFNSNTQISFSLPKSGKTTLEIFNVLGQKVSTLLNEYLAAGNKIMNWDGRDDRGMPVPSGIYLYQLRSGDFIQKKKMVYLK